MRGVHAGAVGRVIEKSTRVEQPWA